MNPETVLIVDDDAEIRGFLQDAVLEPAGYHVLMAADGQEGLELALNQRPDLVLLDIEMPHLSGLDLLSLLQEYHHLIPTIVMSAHGSEEAILQAFRLGAKDFLQKPFSVSEVQSAIESALAEERLRREKEELTYSLTQANRRLQRQLRNWIALNDIARAITTTLEEAEVFKRVMENVNRILQVEAGSILLLDRGTNELLFAITLEGDAVRFSDFRLKMGQGIAGWVAENGEPLLVPDVSQDPRFYAQVDESTGFRTHSILCVPLRVHQKVIGVLQAINKLVGPESPSFTQSDLELLTMLASWVAVAVENARLNRAAREVVVAKPMQQAVVTGAHHINNRLLALQLELDNLEKMGTGEGDAFAASLALLRRYTREISAVAKALSQLKEIRGGT